MVGVARKEVGVDGIGSRNSKEEKFGMDGLG
jgi:hypothetical protein